MKFKILIIILLLQFFSTHESKGNKNLQNKTEKYQHLDSNTTTDSSEIPQDGKYRYDIAFAEWQGKSMGVKVTVIIKGDSIKVIYEGDGNLTAKKGEILDEGIILRHKSGKWIIGHSEKDKEVDEVGGCTEGPRVIDFKNKLYWTC